MRVEQQVIPGDPLVRTRTILAAVLVGTIGLGAVIYAQSYFDTMMALRATKPQVAAAGIKQLCQVLAVCDFLLGTLFAGVLATFSLRVFRSGQVPPAGMRVAFTTKVGTGRSAQVIATSSLVFAIVVFVGFFLVSVHLWTVAQDYGVTYPGPFRAA